MIKFSRRSAFGGFFLLILFFGLLFFVSLESKKKSIDTGVVNQDLSAQNAQIIKDGSSKKIDVNALLKSISHSDIESLERLFRALISKESFGYVIFGNKPIAICPLYPKSTYFNFEKPCLWNYDSLWEDYLVWEKYSHHFPIHHYILRAYPSDRCDGVYEVLCVNKDHCLKAISQNLALFKGEIHHDITPESIMNRFDEKKNSIDNILNHREDLLGVLLGYGKHNSILFQRRLEFELQGKYNPPYVHCYEISLTRFLVNDSSLCFVRFPSFVEDVNHQESIQIKRNYIRMQKRLSEIYSGGSFLEITLSALTREK